MSTDDIAALLAADLTDEGNCLVLADALLDANCTGRGDLEYTRLARRAGLDPRADLEEIAILQGGGFYQ